MNKYLIHTYTGSRFGAVLDMVTDRCSTTCLMVHLAHRYPSWMLFFQVLISLDLSSHYAHMVSSLSLGSASHKKVGPDTPWLLRLYYEKATVLFLVCAGNEVFFMAWYLTGWSQLMVEGSVSRGIIIALGLLSFPVCLFKQILNWIQLVGASRDLVKADAQYRRKGKSKESE